MKKKNKSPEFLNIGLKLLKWYDLNARDLSFRKTKDPYKIWICEIVFQQTRIEQGINHYNQFIKRFPEVETLANADVDDVLLHWKGLGYYSRAINIHKAAMQIMRDFGGKFPIKYEEILTLKGIGKYTAAAICSICFDEKLPAIDGNFYRVLSRIFADDYDVSSSKAMQYFTDLALLIMPEDHPGNFNQAMMDLGSEICKPKNPNCEICPINNDCLAFSLNKIADFPVKSKRVKAVDLSLNYYFIQHKDRFLIKQRGDDFIWKKLYDFPEVLDKNIEKYIVYERIILHKLTHKNLTIHIYSVDLTEKDFINLAERENYIISNLQDALQKSFPKPLENFLNKEITKIE